MERIIDLLILDKEIFLFLKENDGQDCHSERSEESVEGGCKMNSSGWLRSIMAANMETEKFLIHILGTISREFEKEVLVMEIMKDEYMVSFGEYTTMISREMVEKLKMGLDPYKVDKYILNDFMIQGYRFDKRRSGYIRNVFGVFD